MSAILVTGGRGVLGSRLVKRLHSAGHVVRVMSRSAPPERQVPGLEWAQADMETGVGLAEAVRGVAIMVNCATNTFRSEKVDVIGTGRLMAQARAAGVKHVLHVSIVGIEHFPSFFYYHSKLKAEQAVIDSGVPYTIVRATQFHTLLDQVFLRPIRMLRWSPLFLLPTDFQFQLIDAGDVADTMLPLITEQAHGRVPDIGGPEVLKLGEIVRPWMQAQKIHGKVLHFRWPGKTAASFRAGHNTCPDHRQGKITWADYLERKYQTNQQTKEPKIQEQ